MEAYDLTISTDFDTQTGIIEIKVSSSLFSVTLHDWSGDTLEGIKTAIDLYQEELDDLVDRSLPLD